MIYHRDNTAHATGAIYSHAHCDFGRLSTQGSKRKTLNTRTTQSGSQRLAAAIWHLQSFWTSVCDYCADKSTATGTRETNGAA